jgi:hypothetical protein
VPRRSSRRAVLLRDPRAAADRRGSSHAEWFYPDRSCIEQCKRTIKQ